MGTQNTYQQRFIDLEGELIIALCKHDLLFNTGHRISPAVAEGIILSFSLTEHYQAQ